MPTTGPTGRTRDPPPSAWKPMNQATGPSRTGRWPSVPGRRGHRSEHLDDWARRRTGAGGRLGPPVSRPGGAMVGGAPGGAGRRSGRPRRRRRTGPAPLRRGGVGPSGGGGPPAPGRRSGLLGVGDAPPPRRPPASLVAPRPRPAAGRDLPVPLDARPGGGRVVRTASGLGGRTPADLELAYRDVTFPSSDGVDLAGWYVPARNGAAVALLHGAASTRSECWTRRRCSPGTATASSSSTRVGTARARDAAWTSAGTARPTWPAPSTS